MPDETKLPSKALAIAAAIVPWAFALLGTTALIAVARGGAGFARMLRDAGVFGYATLAASLLSLVVLSVVLALCARGRAVPSVVVIGATLLPALAGISGAASSLVRAAGAAASADPSTRAMYLARAISEALNTRLLGAWCAGGLAAAAAVGLALAALAQRAPGRGGVGVGVGLVAALPLLASGGVGIATLQAPLDLVALLPPVALVLPVMLLAGGAIGKGPEARRSAALAAGVPVAMALALTATIAVTSCLDTVAIFGALANAPPGDKDRLIAQAALELDATRAFAIGAPIAGVVAALVLALFGALRARPSAGAIAGAVLVLLVAVGGVAADAIGWRQTARLLPGGHAEPWAGFAGFEPIDAGTGGTAGEPDAIVTTLELAPRNGPRVVLSAGAEALTAALAPIVERTGEPPRSDWPYESLRAADVSPRIALAIDARVAPEHLRALVSAAGRAGAKGLDLVGGRPPVSPDGLEAIRRNVPLFAPFMGGTASTPVLLETALAPTAADMDPVLLHATVGATPVVEVRARVGAPAAPFTIDGRGGPMVDDGTFASQDPGAHPVFLALGPGATAQALTAVVLELQRRRYPVVVVAGDIPGHPDQPVTTDAHGGNDLVPFGSEPRVVGTLSREVIQRIVRRHLPEVRACYERGLVRRPDLAGRVTASITIGSTGAVQDVTLGQSTLGDQDVEQCIRQAVGTWLFPAPEGGVVRVAYPFVLAPSR